MADILMVCVRQDVARTKALAEMFLSEGFSIGDVHTSDAALRSSAAAILVWSHASVRSASFREASRRAIRAGRALIVNLISPSSRPTRIGCSPIFDLSRWAGDPGDAALGPLRHTAANMVKELRNQIEHWRVIRHSDEASVFVDYLARYGPDAAFSDAAEQRLDEIAFGALVGVRAPGAELEQATEDSNLRTAPARRRMSAAACKVQATGHSSPGEVAPCDEGVAPASPASKRRSRPPSSRSAQSSDNARGRDVVVGRQRAGISPEALWSPQDQKTERNGRGRSHNEDALRVTSVERLAGLEKAVRAKAARVALDLHNLRRWAVARIGSLRVAGLGSDRRSADGHEQKVSVAPKAMRGFRRASANANDPSPARRATSGISWSAIEHAIAHCLALGGRMAQNPIAIASLVGGAVLAGALCLTGSASNVHRFEGSIAIEDVKTGDVVFFNEPESTESDAPSSQTPLPAARRARRGERTTTTSPSGPGSAASPVSMSSNDASASAVSHDALRTLSSTESLLSPGSLTTETFAFDLAPHLPQSAENWPAKASTGAAFGNANPMGAPALGGWATRNEILADDSQTGDVRLSAEESVYCPDTTRRADTGLHEPLPGGRSGPNCVVR